MKWPSYCETHNASRTNLAMNFRAVSSSGCLLVLLVCLAWKTKAGLVFLSILSILDTVVTVHRIIEMTGEDISSGS